jgi:hypothetical protein
MVVAVLVEQTAVQALPLRVELMVADKPRLMALNLLVAADVWPTKTT